MLCYRSVICDPSLSMTGWCLPGCHQYFTQMFQAWHLIQSPNMANCLGVGLHHSTTTSFKSASGLGGVFFPMLNRLNTLLVLGGEGKKKKSCCFFSNLQKELLKGTFLSWKVPPHSPPSPSGRIAFGLISLGAGIRILGVWGDKRIYVLFTTMRPLPFQMAELYG